MARPTTFAEVVNNNEMYSGYATTTKRVSSIEIGEFLNSSNIMKAWSDFIKALEHNGFVVEKPSYGASVEVTRPLTASEKMDAIDAAQARWDELEQIYHACDVAGTQPERWSLRAVTQWCETEGKAIPWESAEIDV